MTGADGTFVPNRWGAAGPGAFRQRGGGPTVPPGAGRNRFGGQAAGSRHCEHQPPGGKHHARWRHGPPDRVLWVHDAEQWAFMRKHHLELLCPQPGCTVRLTPVNRAGAPHLRTYGDTSCDHWRPRDRTPSGGGPMSAQHRWLQLRLVSICRGLGYHDAVPEDPVTRADVYVPQAHYALEVQLRPTQFARRTAARAARGANTLWLLPPNVSGPAVEHALFRSPCVRLRVVDGRDPDWRTSVEPWLDEQQLNPHARLVVQATVLQLCDRAPYLQRRPMDGWAFLKQVLSGDRRWLPSLDSPQLPTGGCWVRDQDLTSARRRLADDARAARAAAAARRTTRPPVEPVTPPVPAPTADRLTAPQPAPVSIDAAAGGPDALTAPLDQPTAAAPAVDTATGQPSAPPATAPPNRLSTTLPQPVSSGMTAGERPAATTDPTRVPVPPPGRWRRWWRRLTGANRYPPVGGAG